MNNDALHDWLLSQNGDSTDQLWTDLAALRSLNPKPYQALPASRELLVAGLVELERAGLARREGEGDAAQWWWKRLPEKQEAQQALFA